MDKESHTKKPKISDLMYACDCLDNLRISINDIESDNFMYFNNALREIIAFDNQKLIDGGWHFWFSIIDPMESPKVKKKIFDFFTSPYQQSPFVIKYHIKNGNNKRLCIRHEILLHTLENKILAINYFFDITEKEDFERHFHLANVSWKHNNSINSASVISPREKEVLLLVADGFSSKQIADRLFISNHTAISHRKHLIKKFEVKNTAQLIKRASRIKELW